MTSHDPDFWQKAADVCGLYLNPPDNAVVWSVDEKSGIQAKSRINPTRPAVPGIARRQEFEYRRNGTAVLFAGLNVHDGDVAGWVTDSTRSDNFVEFLGDLDAQTPSGMELHCCVNNFSAHFTPAVESFLDEHPRIFLHDTPTHASWLNQVELFFSILERRLLRNGEFDVTGPQSSVHLICPPDLGPELRESGGADVVGVHLLMGDRGEHAEPAVPAGPVVEHVDPVEDLRRQLRAGPPLRSKRCTCLGAVVAVDHRAGAGQACLDGHPERRVDHRCRGPAVQGPAHHPAGPGVEHHAAVQLPLSGGVLGDVGHPQLIGPVAGEEALNEVFGGRSMGGAGLGLAPGRRSADALGSHVRADQLLVDPLAVVVGELCSDPPPAVGPPRPHVISVITSPSQARRMARRLGGMERHRKKPEGATPSIRQALLVPWPSLAKVSTIPKRSFGRTTRPRPNSSLARLTVASSDSSSAIRRLAARSSADSAVGVPVSSLRSMRS